MTELAAVPRVPPHASALIWRDVSRELASLGFTEHDLGVISTAVEGFYDSFDTPIVFSPIFRGSNVASGSRLGVLIRLFQEGDRVPCDELGCLLSSSSLALLEEAGFLSKESGDYVANGSLVPWGGGLVAADRYDAEGHGDYVFRPNVSTSNVRALFPPIARNLRAIDIGAGSGALTINLARSQAEITAVDLNPRALDFVRFNCALNGVPIPRRIERASHEVLAEDQWEFVVFNEPMTYQTDTSLCWGYSDAALGRSVMRDAYRLVARSSTVRFAVLRHDMMLSGLSEAGFLKEIGDPGDLQILYMHEAEAEYAGNRQAWSDAPHERVTLEAGGWVMGVALVRPRPSADAPRVSFMPLSNEQMATFTARRFWARLATVPGWADAVRVLL